MKADFQIAHCGSASPPGAVRPGGRAACAPPSRAALDNPPARRIIPAP